MAIFTKSMYSPPASMRSVTRFIAIPRSATMVSPPSRGLPGRGGTRTNAKAIFFSPGSCSMLLLFAMILSLLVSNGRDELAIDVGQDAAVPVIEQLLVGINAARDRHFVHGPVRPAHAQPELRALREPLAQTGHVERLPP